MWSVSEVFVIYYVDRRNSVINFAWGKFQKMGKWDVGTEGECSRMSSNMKEEGDVEFGNR